MSACHFQKGRTHSCLVHLNFLSSFYWCFAVLNNFGIVFCLIFWIEIQFWSVVWFIKFWIPILATTKEVRTPDLGNTLLYCAEFLQWFHDFQSHNVFLTRELLFNQLGTLLHSFICTSYCQGWFNLGVISLQESCREVQTVINYLKPQVLHFWNLPPSAYVLNFQFLICKSPSAGCFLGVMLESSNHFDPPKFKGVGLVCVIFFF